MIEGMWPDHAAQDAQADAADTPAASAEGPPKDGAADAGAEPGSHPSGYYGSGDSLYSPSATPNLGNPEEGASGDATGPPENAEPPAANAGGAGGASAAEEPPAAGSAPQAAAPQSAATPLALATAAGATTAAQPAAQPSGTPRPTLPLASPPVTVTVTASATGAASSRAASPSVGGIVGGVLGALALLAALGAALVFLRRRRRRYAPLKRVPREEQPLVRPFDAGGSDCGGGGGGGGGGSGGGVRKSMTDTVLVPTERSAGFAFAPRARDSMSLAIDLSQLNQATIHEMAQRTQRAERTGLLDDTAGAGPAPRDIDEQPVAGPSTATGSSSERRYDPPAYASWPAPR